MRIVIGLLACWGIAHADTQKCVIEKPVAVASLTLKPPPCHRASKAIEKSIAGEIAKTFRPTHGGTLDVKFPCDGLGAKLAEITIETGGGHGGSLDLWRARRRSDGKWDVRGILFRGTSMTRQAVDPPHVQAAAIVELPDLDTTRAAMTATIQEIVPKKTRKGGSVTGFGSSRNFHLALRIVDDDGRVVERRYTGYESSGSQGVYLGLEIAARALSPIITLAAGTNAADQDDRAFFAATFNAAVPHFDDQYYWWVMERYVDLARFLGTPQIIGGLLTRMTVTTTDRSVDARANAVDALARITAWDARKTTKTVEEAAAAYLSACK